MITIYGRNRVQPVKGSTFDVFETVHMRRHPKCLVTFRIFFAGGHPLSNTTHDAFDPRRSYGKFGTLEREKGASAAECFKEFT
jgi:hypothetical protein